MLAVGAQHAAVGVDHDRTVVVHTADRAFVERDHQRDPELAGQVLHHPRGRSVGNVLGGLIPLRILLGAEVGTVEQLLETDNLRPALRGLADHADVLGDGDALVLGDRSVAVGVVMGLDQADADGVAHGVPHSCTGRKGADF